MDQAPTRGEPPVPAGRDVGADLEDFVTFNYMITPAIGTGLWVFSSAGITLLAGATFKTDALVAVVGWVSAMIWLRVAFEVLIVLFRINEGIQDIAGRHPPR